MKKKGTRNWDFGRMLIPIFLEVRWHWTPNPEEPYRIWISLPRKDTVLNKVWRSRADLSRVSSAKYNYLLRDFERTSFFQSHLNAVFDSDFVILNFVWTLNCKPYLFYLNLDLFGLFCIEQYSSISFAFIKQNLACWRDPIGDSTIITLIEL